MIEQLLDIWLYGLVPAFIVFITVAGHSRATYGQCASTTKIIVSTLIWPYAVIEVAVAVILNLVTKAF